MLFRSTNLRAKHDAILVGVNTIVKDDPMLNARFSSQSEYHPWRIILDPNLRTPVHAKVVTDAHASKTIIITSPDNLVRSSTLLSKSAMILGVEKSGDGFDWEELWSALLSTQNNGFNGLTSILVEGGMKTWGLFRKAGMVDMEVSLVGD